jgi:hypothetical protein
VNKYPAARICPPFYPDVGGCAQDEIDAWVTGPGHLPLDHSGGRFVHVPS